MDVTIKISKAGFLREIIKHIKEARQEDDSDRTFGYNEGLTKAVEIIEEHIKK